jgi:hypothetical protein
LQFLNPLALIGLAAAAIPLALHLLNRGRPRAVPFSNLRFLRQLHQSRMRSVRLRQWWVLLLRTLALIALAVAFSRPALNTSTGDWLAASRPVTAVLLMDRSYSVSARLGSDSVFDQLRRRARQTLALFDEDDRLYLIGFDDQTGEPLNASADRLWQQIEEMTPGHGGTDLGRALTRAYRLLGDAQDSALELYLLTDGARPGWHAAAVPAPPGLHTFVLPPDQRPMSNHAVVAVGHEPWLSSPGERLDLTVRVHLHGPLPSDSPAVDLYVDGERLQRRQVDLAAIQTDADHHLIDVPFSIAPRRAGRLPAFAQIDGDAVSVDDRFHFVIDAPDSISILLLGPTSASTYYPRRALAAASTGDRSLRVRARPFPAATAEDWAWADVIILCDVERLQDNDRALLQQHVEAGGGVMLFPGDRADLQHLNRDVLPSLLPASIAGVRHLSDGVRHLNNGVRHLNNGVRHLNTSTPTTIDTSRLHPILFRQLDPGQAPTTFASFELVAEHDAEILATYSDERPVLVGGHLAQGRAILWSVPLNLTWSQWPESGWFLPVLQRLTRRLALVNPADRGYQVGQHAWRRLPGIDADRRVQAHSPSGQRRYVETERVLGERRWKIPSLEEAGFWSLRLEAQTGEPRTGPDALSAQTVFAVNVDSNEADLSRVNDDDLRRILGEDAMIVAPGTPLDAVVTAQRVGQEIWQVFLALAGLLLLLELWISRAPSGKAASGAAPSIT